MATTDPTVEHAETSDSWIRRRPVHAFFALAFTISWAVWLLALVTGSSVAFRLGGLGPVVAAAAVAARLGTYRSWLARVRTWRVPLGYYVLVLLAPPLLYGAMNLVLPAFGLRIDPTLLADRLPAYGATWLMALWAGIVEEPGWRGFALPKLQERYSPVRATLLLGLLWGLWHLPISPQALLVTLPLAFFYTWLYNRTHSVVLCVLLHASITPAQNHLGLVGDQVAFAAVQLATLVAAAVALVVATRGRLGLPEHTATSTP